MRTDEFTPAHGSPALGRGRNVVSFQKLATVWWLTSCPRLLSAPTIQRYPQLRFSLANCKTNFSILSRVELLFLGVRFFEPSNFLAISRGCQERIVSGRTICATSWSALRPRRLAAEAKLIRSGLNSAPDLIAQDSVLGYQILILPRVLHQQNP